MSAYNNVALKAIVALPLLGAAWTTVTCPCEVLLDCHVKTFFGLVGVSAAFAALILLVRGKLL